MTAGRPVEHQNSFIMEEWFGIMLTWSLPSPRKASKKCCSKTCIVLFSSNGAFTNMQVAHALYINTGMRDAGFRTVLITSWMVPLLFGSVLNLPPKFDLSDHRTVSIFSSIHLCLGSGSEKAAVFLDFLVSYLHVSTCVCVCSDKLCLQTLVCGSFPLPMQWYQYRILSVSDAVSSESPRFMAKVLSFASLASNWNRHIIFKDSGISDFQHLICCLFVIFY